MRIGARWASAGTRACLYAGLCVVLGACERATDPAASADLIKPGGGAPPGATGAQGTAPLPKAPWYPCGEDRDVVSPLPRAECGALEKLSCDLELRALVERGRVESGREHAWHFYYDTQGRLACIRNADDPSLAADTRYDYEGDRVTETTYVVHCADGLDCRKHPRLTTYDVATGRRIELNDRREGLHATYDAAGRILETFEPHTSYAYSFFPDGRVDTKTRVGDAVDAVVFNYEYVDTDQSTVQYEYDDAGDPTRVSVSDLLGNRVLEYDPKFDPAGSFSAYLPNRLTLFRGNFNHSQAIRSVFADDQFPRAPFSAGSNEVADLDVSIAPGLEFSVHYGFVKGDVSRVNFAWNEAESLSLLIDRCDGSVSETLEAGPDGEVRGVTQRTFYYGCASDPAPASACLSPCEP